MIRGVLFDLSGVLYVGDEAIEGAGKAIESLRRQELPLRFVTNVTRQPAHALRSRLARMGLPIGDDELITAPRAARAYLLRRKLVPHLLVHPALKDEFSDLIGADTPTAVLVGDAGDDFNYASLNRAFRLLMDGA
ncbi:MAG: TIGR01458 family HAD-type hydrolase, partial [Gammaproteobacteria bacterium]|nr:TIGR01458 family HAD-type hydrolase [Gammaproteobacteria bacterium]